LLVTGADVVGNDDVGCWVSEDVVLGFVVVCVVVGDVLVVVVDVGDVLVVVVVVVDDDGGDLDVVVDGIVGKSVTVVDKT